MDGAAQDEGDGVLAVQLRVVRAHPGKRVGTRPIARVDERLALRIKPEWVPKCFGRINGIPLAAGRLVQFGSYSMIVMCALVLCTVS
jgi:hypothetical protein